MVNRISTILPYLVTRMTEKGQVYFEDDVIVMREHLGAVGPEGVSWLVMQPFSFGTYEWEGSIGAPHANVSQFIGLIETHHGWAAEGGIFLENRGANYFLSTGDTSPVTLLGQDWTKNTRFKVIWSSDYIKLYIDGVFTAQKITNVPQSPGNLFGEIYVYSGTTTTLNLQVNFKNLLAP